jgi:hypothetical protein
MTQSRRQFLAAGAAVAAVAAAPKVLAQSAPFNVSQRYPDPLVRAIDPSFGRYRIGLAKVERISSKPARCGNLCFGGRYRNRLLMTAATSVYSLYVNTQGVLGG